MKKCITIILEVNSNETLTDNFIREDLEQEINCASESYDIKSIKIESLA